MFQEGEAIFALSQEDEATSALNFTSQHNQQPNNSFQQQHTWPSKHNGDTPPSRDLFNWSVEYFSSSHSVFNIKNDA